MRYLRPVLLVVVTAAASLLVTGNSGWLSAQDGFAGISGVVEDVSGARIARASVTLLNPRTGFQRQTVCDGSGNFAFAMLPSGQYEVKASTADMAAKAVSAETHVGAVLQLHIRLAPAGRVESVTVEGSADAVAAQSSEATPPVTQEEIGNLPLNGRRFTDLALLTPGVVPDPRGLTSDSNGDLSYGGVRGFQNNFLVDGADNNNSFYAQARGRYRAPYQFSNEVIKEFRVASNSYSAELGRAGGAVFNVVTKSGTNDWHGTGFYYLRDSLFDAKQPYTDLNPRDRRQQFGATLGGPIRRDRAFFYAGFDEHVLTVPSIMQFANGAATVQPQPDDYDYKDQQLVEKAAQQLNSLSGYYPTKMSGNAIFAKADYYFSPKHFGFLRLNTSRYSGTNNVFFDPSSPLTAYAESDNGTEDVRTESLAGSLVSSWTTRLATNLRVQFSRDVQLSTANSSDPLTKIYNLVGGMGRSSMLPRQTREHKLHAAETFSYQTPRVQWKFGGDLLQAWIYDYFPAMFGGEYYFDNVKVNPFTFAPMRYGEPLTPLRAFAHDVPRYYMQDFGTATSNPNSRTYDAFLQTSWRITRDLTLNAGVRYDLQSFQEAGLVTNPLYLPSGMIPTISNNFSPRIGLAYGVGQHRPFMVRAGFGIFYMQIPNIYASHVATDNGLTQTQLFLDNMNQAQAAVFPTYPYPLVNCPPGSKVCAASPALAGFLTTQISAFAPNYQTPYTEQGSVTVERELGARFTLSASYLYVHGLHLLRSLDANLPKPTTLEYPVYDDSGSVFLGMDQVASFANWQTTPTVECPYPPCLNDVQRPDPRLGIINSYESQASSLYNGFTVSLQRKTSHGMFLRVAYTLAKAVDDGPDSLVVGRPGNVQNSYATSLERAPSVEDQRHRLMAAWVLEPKFSEFSNGAFNALANNWKLSSIVSFGSGRPVSAVIAGDPNRDDNTYNDRLPGYRRNGFIGPDYFTTDLRIARTIKLLGQAKLQALVEMFNTFNRTNSRVNISDDGFYNSAGEFIAYSSQVGSNYYPGQYRKYPNFLAPTNAYAPRQLQLSLRLNY